MSFCSRVALEAHESVAGTAPRGRAYLFLPVAKRFWGASEMNASWARPQDLIAIAAARRDGVVTRLYNPSRDNDGAAPMLVYRPAATDDPDALAPLLTLMSERWQVDMRQKPRLAICTHGTRDRCCAKWGFAAYGQARGLFEAGRTVFEPLECSHLGGDRFAATGIMFPSGSMYAHLDQIGLDALGAAEAAGAILPELYRGSVFEAPLIQTIRAGLAGQGLYNNASAPIMVEPPDPARKVYIAKAGGMRFEVTMKEVEVRFFASCERLASARSAAGRRSVYVAARPLFEPTL